MIRRNAARLFHPPRRNWVRTLTFLIVNYDSRTWKIHTALLTVVNTLLHSSPVELCYSYKTHNAFLWSCETGQFGNFLTFVLGWRKYEMLGRQVNPLVMMNTNISCSFDRFYISIVNINFQELKLSNRMDSFCWNLALMSWTKKLAVLSFYIWIYILILCTNYIEYRHNFTCKKYYF